MGFLWHESAGHHFFRESGSPDFRYTGSDPAQAVWNLGWAVALVIYDSRSGAHFGPFLYFVVPAQAALISVFIVVWRFRRRPRQGVAPKKRQFHLVRRGDWR